MSEANSSDKTLEMILEFIREYIDVGDTEKAAELALAYQRIKSVQNV